MDTEAYWYYINGHFGQHVTPPTDPSTISFIKVTTTDIPYRKVRAEITQCIEGHYHKPEIFESKPYESISEFRERVIKYIKSILKLQRSITEWGTLESRTHKKKKPVVKRYKRGRK